LKILKWFKKKKSKQENPYTKMGSVGISPAYFKMYQNSIEKLRKE
jgi:hypothetical protein